MPAFNLPRRSGLIFIAALLTGCATHNQLLKPDANARVSEVHVLLVIPQEGFTFSAAAPGVAAAGGLIPALIDASIQKSRQESLRAHIVPLLDKLIEVDFREEARAAAATQQAAFPIKVASVTIVPQVPTQKQTAALQARLPQGAAVMRVLFHYELDHETLVLTTRSYATMSPRGELERLYSGSVVFQGRAFAPALAQAEVRGGMRESVSETLRLLAMDMRRTESAPARPKITGTWRNGALKVPVSGEAIDDGQNRVALRDATGTVMTMSKD